MISENAFVRPEKDVVLERHNVPHVAKLRFAGWDQVFQGLVGQDSFCIKKEIPYFLLTADIDPVVYDRQRPDYTAIRQWIGFPVGAIENQ